MAQPEFVPLHAGDRVRPAERMPAHGGWRQDRAAELAAPGVPTGARFGTPGPDQGYGLTLAQRFADRLELAEGEHKEDIVTGCLGVGLRRASLFGRAPVIHDLDLAFTIFGYLGGAPGDLLAFRLPLLRGAADDYWIQRDVADKVAEPTLRLTPAQARAKLAEWRSFFVA